MQFEVEIATAEMERAQQRLMTLEKEKEDLVAQVSKPPQPLDCYSKCRSSAYCIVIEFRPLNKRFISGRMQMSVGEENQPAAVSVSRQNEDSLRAELSSQRELVSRLHSEISSCTSSTPPPLIPATAPASDPLQHSELAVLTLLQAMHLKMEVCLQCYCPICCIKSPKTISDQTLGLSQCR